MAVVILSSRRELGVVKAVAKNGKTTVLTRFVRDFGTLKNAVKFVNDGFVPEGYRGHPDIIDTRNKTLVLADRSVVEQARLFET